MKTTICKIAAPVLLGGIFFASGSVLANPPEFHNTYDTAVIDGVDGEWDLDKDFFANMYEAGNPEKELLSESYLRYDCNSKTMFLLVRDVEGDPVMEDEAWVKVYELGNSPVVDIDDDNGGTPTGTPPEFSWISSDGDALIGWEASFPLLPGPHTIEIHVNHTPGRTSSTGRPDPLNFDVVCDETPPDEPKIDIEKATNGADADSAPGPNVANGQSVTWTYIVTNTGNVPLSNIIVTDDQGVDVDCGSFDDTLAAGASATCTGSGSADCPETGFQYSNKGSVAGDHVADDGTTTTVSDNDFSHYKCIPGVQSAPAIDIEKSTNGHDADIGTGPILLVGQPVTWTYEVTNTGNVDLKDIHLTDDRLGTLSCLLPSLFTVGMSITCTADDSATAGQYENKGCAEGAYVVYDADGNEVKRTTVTDCDLSHYFGADPQLDIEKYTQGADADEEEGPYIEVGTPVYWRYEVKNTGNVDLSDVVVTDDDLSITVNCGSNSDVIANLPASETFNCMASGTATVGQYANLGTAESSFIDDESTEPPVNDEDPSHYFGAEPGIDIEKCTSSSALGECPEGDSANHDNAPGAIFLEDDSVFWIYTVTNTGNVPLNNVIVSDDQNVSVDCGDGTNTIASLPLDGSATCTASGTAVLGQYENTGKAASDCLTVVTDAVGTEDTICPEDTDPSHYYAFSTEQPSIELSVTDFRVEGEDNQFNNGTFIVENASGGEEVTALLVQDVDITIAYRVSKDGKGKKTEWNDVNIFSTCTTTPAIPFVIEGPGEWVEQGERGSQAFDFSCTAEAGEIPADYSSVRATVCVQIFNRYDKVKGKVTEDAKWFCSSSDM